jgi:uncharacterized protein (DUF362 family)
MVASAGLIVVSHDANAFDYIGEAILQIMPATRDRMSQTPHDQFHKGLLVENKALGEERFCIHVVNDTNN